MPNEIPNHRCELCPLFFSKLSKLNKHLLNDHGAHWRLAPGNPGGPVAAVVSRAVARANRAFDGTQAPASVPCVECPPGGATFRNPRDLAHHILSKHSDDALSPDDKSKVSNMKRKTPAPANSSAVSPDSAAKKVKKVKKATAEPALPVEPKPKPSAAKPPLSPKSASREASPKLVNAAVKRSDSSKDGTSKKTENVPIGLDFSSVVGFTPNARKSYYRVVKR